MPDCRTCLVSISDKTLSRVCHTPNANSSAERALPSGRAVHSKLAQRVTLLSRGMAYARRMIREKGENVSPTEHNQKLSSASFYLCYLLSQIHTKVLSHIFLIKNIDHEIVIFGWGFEFELLEHPPRCVRFNEKYLFISKLSPYPIGSCPKAWTLSWTGEQCALGIRNEQTMFNMVWHTLTNSAWHMAQYCQVDTRLNVRCIQTWFCDGCTAGTAVSMRNGRNNA